MSESLLEIKKLTKVYGSGITKSQNTLVALQDFELTIPKKPAKIIAIAGESGSGKSTLANLVLGLIAPTSGQIFFREQELSKMDRTQRMDYTRHVQAVFQDPYSVYNPFYPVKHIFDIAIKNFKLAKNRNQENELIEEALNMVGLQSQEVLHKFPHQLSGGQRQRLMVARAYLLKPDLIVADEPVSMVDASLRATILDIMQHLRDDRVISILYITHDLSTAYLIADEIYLLYQGSPVERGEVTEVIDNPKHPYVQQLINSIPDINHKWSGEITALDDEQLRSRSDSGCRFYYRCPQKMDHCLEKQPSLEPFGKADHHVACHLYAAPPD
jgi:peptide/nickel transport system ATP-binding protein